MYYYRNQWKKYLSFSFLILGVFGVVYSAYFHSGSINTSSSVVSSEVIIPKYSSENCRGIQCLLVRDLEYPVRILTEDVISSLQDALLGEYYLNAYYLRSLQEFPLRRPFVMIVRQQEIRTSELSGLFDKYGLDIPVNPYTASGKISFPKESTGSLDPNAFYKEVCKGAMDLEIKRFALYERQIFPIIKEYSDMAVLISEIMTDSQEGYLPSVTLCSH